MKVDDLEALPHWARVVFAARCARAVLPHMRRAWPNISTEHLRALEAAIALTEEASTAGKGQGQEQLLDAAIGSMGVAGLALMPSYGFESEEPVPSGNDNCLISSFAAKIVEWSARAAHEGPETSANALLEAWSYVGEIAGLTNDCDHLTTNLQRELSQLGRVAARGRWTDETPVPPSVFELLSKG
jgi:hypothetical protein